MDNPFWRFSLQAYERPGVAALCLTAQDNHGVEVNFLLYAAWLALHGQGLEANHLAAQVQATAVWRERVLHPLRALRRSWRDLAEAAVLRRDLLTLELGAERSMQDAMWNCYCSQAPAAGKGDLRANLAAVFDGAGLGPEEAAYLLAPLTAALRP